MSTLKKCRICSSNDLIDVVNLGNQYVASQFPTPEQKDCVPAYPLVLSMCQNCSLVQLKHTVQQKDMYEQEYGYRSGISNTMKQHLQQFNQEIQNNFKMISGRQLNDNDFVLDIGSNDTTFLRYYPEATNKVGCDPTGKQFREYYKDDIKLIPTYFDEHAVSSVVASKFSIVTSISMFYDLPDPVQFAKDINTVLQDDGIWVFEQSYSLMMINQNSFDTICHEHLEYYNMKNIVDICNAASFKIYDVKFNECNGGSMRVYAHKANHVPEQSSELNMDSLLQQEAHLYQPETYQQWMQSCTETINKTKAFIETCQNNNQSCYVYGASTKGNTLLQYIKCNNQQLQFAVERNLNKVGKMTPGTNIPIISEDTMRNNIPYAMIVLPWHFKDEIIAREQEYLNAGGSLIFPLPEFEIVSKKKPVVITGVNGQIAHYLIQQLQEQYAHEYNIYGLTRSFEPIKDVLIFDQAILQRNELNISEYILMVKPAIVFHLASMTNVDECNMNAIQAIQINGLMVCEIADCIYKHKLATKLIHTSSCELYKGHGEYVIQEDDLNYKPSHPYAYAKCMAQQMLDHYKQQYNCWISNAILFTTESPHRKSTFLIKKCADHIKQWKNTTNCRSLQLGNLNNFRNVNHASDVAQALLLISQQSQAQNYLVCSSLYFSVKQLIIDMYKQADIQLIETTPGCLSIQTNQGEIQPVIQYNCSTSRYFDANINGNCTKLHEIGWQPEYTTLKGLFDDLLQDQSNK